MAATSAFLKTKLASRRSKQRLKSVKYAMFKDFGYNRADGNTPEIIARSITRNLPVVTPAAPHFTGHTKIRRHHGTHGTDFIGCR